MKKTISLILTVLLLASLLTGCGSTEPAAPETTAQPQTMSVDESGKWTGRGGCCKLEITDGEVFYSSMKRGDGNTVYSSGSSLMSMDGTVIGDVWVYAYAPAADGVWYGEWQGYDENGQYRSDSRIVKLGMDGAELAAYDIPDRVDEIYLGADGLLYVCDTIGDVAAVYTQEGERLGSIDISAVRFDQYSLRLEQSGDGSIWLHTEQGEGGYVYPIDSAALTLGTEYALPQNTQTLYTGNAEHPFLCATDEELSWWSPEGGTELILVWEECGISGGGDDMRSIIPDGDGFICLYAGCLARISPASPDEVKPKVVLTMAAPWEESAADFNMQSDEYYIKVKDYSEGGEFDTATAYTRMLTDIAAGNSADLYLGLDLIDMGTDKFGSNGLLMDIYQLIDADPELSRDDFWLLKALERDGRLYRVMGEFAIDTYYGFTDTVGDRYGWTWDEYFAMQDALPDGAQMLGYRPADMFIRNSLSGYLRSNIDWANRTCSFDTPEFVRILSAARDGSNPNESAENMNTVGDVYQAMADGRLILSGTWMIMPETFAEAEKTFGRRISYIGWPTPDGGCGSFVVAPTRTYAISAQTRCPEGCWAFAKYILTQSGGWGMSMYKPALEAQVRELQGEHKNMWGETVGATMNAEQAADFLELVRRIDTVCIPDGSSIYKIVTESMQPMLAGDKTPEETAKLIQSKLSIYLAEQG